MSVLGKGDCDISRQSGSTDKSNVHVCQDAKLYERILVRKPWQKTLFLDESVQQHIPLLDNELLHQSHSEKHTSSDTCFQSHLILSNLKISASVLGPLGLKWRYFYKSG